MCEGWLPAQPVEAHKHRPPGGKKTWDEIVKGTTEGRRVSKYHHNMNLEDISRLEMLYSQETGIYHFGANQYETHGWLLIHKDHVRLHVIRVEGLIIGASLGEETNLVLVNRSQSGPVHGYPITEAELEKKKRKYQNVTR